MDGAVGVHLVSQLDLVGSPRRSVVAHLGPDAVLRSLATADDDASLIALILESGSPLVVVDAPLEVPNMDGRRGLEVVLAWCDIAAFPVSRRRLDTVFGGARGVAVNRALASERRRLVEGLPDQVLRQIAWEAARPEDRLIDLADYRAAWLGVRPPRFRPKGVGRARPEGSLVAWELLARVVDMGGWMPDPSADDWGAIADAARIDAICSAYCGLRLQQDRAVCVGAPGQGTAAIAVDANLRARVAMTLERLRSEGRIVI